jgi:hypothetical protein
MRAFAVRGLILLVVVAAALLGLSAYDAHSGPPLGRSTYVPEG